MSQVPMRVMNGQMGSYWKGSDGQVYVQGDEGTNAAGSFDDGSDKYWGSLGYRRIQDPSAPQTGEGVALAASTSLPSAGGGGGGGGSSEPAKVLNSAAVDNTNKAISSLDKEQSIGYKNIDDDFNAVTGRYDLERSQNKADLDEGVTTNNQNLQRNRQNSLVSAAQGLRGLRGVLSSVGALSGDGGRLANEAVTTEANQDLGEAQETAATNAQTLNRSWEKFDEEDDQRRAEASTAKVNSRTALEGSIAGKRQGLLQKLAELFGDVDDTGNAKKYLDQAGDLNSTIASKTRVQAAPITAKKAAFTPGDLESYLAGAGDMTVGVQDGAPGVGGATAVLAGRDAGQEDERRQRKLSFATV